MFEEELRRSPVAESPVSSICCNLLIHLNVSILIHEFLVLGTEIDLVRISWLSYGVAEWIRVHDESIVFKLIGRLW